MYADAHQFGEGFSDAHRLCSRNDAPLRSYVLIVQAIKNAVDCIIKGEDGKLNWILGPDQPRRLLMLLIVDLTWTMPNLLAARLDSLMNTIFGVS